jgi:hypothetical protein
LAGLDKDGKGVIEVWKWRTRNNGWD